MATAPKHHWSIFRHHRTSPAKRDPEQEQLHRDRVTALIVLGIMTLVFAAIIALAAMSGAPAGSDTIQPWIMP